MVMTQTLTLASPSFVAPAFSPVVMLNCQILSARTVLPMSDVLTAGFTSLGIGKATPLSFFPLRSSTFCSRFYFEID